MATMASNFIAIASLALLLFSCSLSSAEHFYINLRWPGGLCNKGQCCFPTTMPLQNDFLINSLTRDLGNGSYPTCNRSPFYVNVLQSVIEEMYTYWPSITCPSDPGLREWESAWDDNGICSGFTQKNYFLKALALRNSANLVDKLARKGILPSKYSDYMLSDVENAINEGLGGVKTAVLACVAGSTTSSILRSVRLCADQTATTFITCPVQRKSSCAARVKLEPLPYNTFAGSNPIEMVVSE